MERVTGAAIGTLALLFVLSLEAFSSLMFRAVCAGDAGVLGAGRLQGLREAVFRVPPLSSARPAAFPVRSYRRKWYLPCLSARTGRTTIYHD